MIEFINRISDKLLGRHLPFDPDLPLSYLLVTILQRMLMLLRGLVRGIWCKKRGRNFFVGAHVKLRCRSKLTVGDGVSFQDYVIIDALSKEGIIIGDHCSVGVRSQIKTSGSLTKVGKGFRMGRFSAMGNDCFVGAAGGVTIGDYVAIGQNVRFHSENHEFRDPDKLIAEQGVTNEGIEVGSDCWIGAGAVILDGVTIEDGCVIGANTLVNKSIPAYSIAVGNPVRIVGNRKELANG